MTPMAPSRAEVFAPNTLARAVLHDDAIANRVVGDGDRGFTTLGACAEFALGIVEELPMFDSLSEVIWERSSA